MNTKTVRKKLCWNCEGSVSLEVENCPYCAVYLSPISLNSGDKENNLFSPPYNLRNSSEEQQIPAPPYSHDKIEEGTTAHLPLKSMLIEKKQLENLLPLILLLTGMQFFIFGFAMWLFAKNGTFFLQWNASYWFIYFVLGIILLGFGWRILQRSEES